MTLRQDEAVQPAATLTRLGAVGLITLNRPQALNAVNAKVSSAVGAALEELASDPRVQAAVITGAGRAFCVGMDLKAAAAGESVFADGHEDWGFAGLVRHFIDKPIIAAVNGAALGGGMEIVLACDLAVADEQAMLGLPEVSHGLFAAGGGVLRLPRQVPRKVALEMALTGQPINATAAAGWGLINRVAPAGKSLEVALQVAEIIAGNAPLAVRSSKRLIYRNEAYGSDWDDQTWRENLLEWNVISASQDAKEGPRAFAEKRAPRWHGR
jgi:crotonobetainyl-CoA hydratase